jgi:predicted ribosome quality control (RQC) complex YloA/Tae2 family protein
MPFDAVFLGAVANELRERAIGAKIDKVQQPSRDTVLLQLRSRTCSERLLITVGASHARIQFTQSAPENPATPPMFCMLLRKHLVGGRILAISQPPMERMIDLTLECTDEMGERSEKHLIAELMGRNSNLILLGADGRIIDCLRRVDYEMSEKRQVLPGLFYHLPPAQEKLDPTQVDAEQIARALPAPDEHKKADSWLVQTFSGLPPLICRELAFRFCGETDPDIGTWDAAQRKAFTAHLAESFAAIQSGKFSPQLLVQDGHPTDYTYTPITQYGSFITCQQYPSFSALLDEFYTARDHADRMRQKSQTVVKTVTSLRDRAARKLANQRKELEATYDRERLRQLGDIVMANLHRITRGQIRLTAEDFYDPDMKEIEITLSPTLSPQQNAAKFYKDYTRAKNAEKYLTEQIAKGETELDYLSSVLDTLNRAESDRDLAEIRQELVSGGYLREVGGKKKMKLPPSKPMEFRSSEGFLIHVGRNNRQNDQLTLKTAQKNDIWLHTQKIHGSHVIIECEGRQPGDQTVTEAATLAAYYSQAREGQNVPVDYTPVKFVKKPAGAKPGMVIYTTYSTAFVTPDAKLAEQLRLK